MLQEMFDIKINRFCPPRGYTSEFLTEITLKLYEYQRLTKGEGLVHLHPNSGANNNKNWIDYASTIQVKELWGHSNDFDKYHMWGDIEAYFEEYA